MDMSTAVRFHSIEIVLSSLFRVVVIYFLGISIKSLFLYESLLIGVILFHHANIILLEKIDRFLRVFIATPAMHKVHHSEVRLETDSNYSSLLSIWDRVFGSFKLVKELKNIRFGI